MKGNLVHRIVASFVVGLGLMAGAAHAGDWFLHPFGEERRYLKDWLAVCDNAGAGPCRVVQIPPTDGDASNDQRLALHARPTGGWEVSVFDRDLPAFDLQALGFDVDGRVLVQPDPDSWRRGEGDVFNIADTITIDEPTTLAALIPALRLGSKVTVRYAPQAKGDGQAVFSLRGLVAAMRAVDEKLGRYAPD